MKTGSPARGLLQSQEEWAQRNKVLADSLVKLIRDHLADGAIRALDLGCEKGTLTEMFAERISLVWCGIDPVIPSEMPSPHGLRLLHGSANAIPFPNSYFDCITFANVYEHINPLLYDDSLAEIRRVLAPQGILVGQIPNPYFPIESHSRLPFMGWLPNRLQKIYWRLSPTQWEHDFYVVTARQLRRRAEAMGFKTAIVRNFNYPAEVIPYSVRWAARSLALAMRFMPWAWQFVFVKDSIDSESTVS